MALDLGHSVATIDLNISNFVSNANKAKQAADTLNGAGSTAFAPAESRLDAFASKLDQVGGKLAGFGTKMTAAVTLPIIGMGAVMFKSAADLEQTMGAVPQIFGSASDSVVSWSENSASAFGMTQQEALGSATVFGALFDQLGVGEEEVANLSQGFVGLSADMSAMWGGTSTEASQALTSALRGNYESMDKYGVNLTEAMVSQEAMNVAVAAGRDEVTEADKIQARHNLIMEQSTTSQGQFARETNTASGAMAIMKANLGDAAAGFGKLLLPAGTKAAQMLSNLVKRIDSLSDTQKKWVLGIAGAAAAIGPLLLVTGKMMQAFSTILPVIKLVGAAIGLIASPVGLVVLGIAALVAGLIYAYTHFEGFKNVVDSVASALMDFATGAIQMVIDAWNTLKDAFDADGWSGVWDVIKTAALDGLRAIGDAIMNTDWMGILQSAWEVLSGANAWLIAKMGDIAGALWSWFWGAVSGIDWGGVLSTAWDVLLGVSSWVLDKIGTLSDKLLSWFQGAVDGVDWSGILSVSWDALVGASAWVIEKLGDLAQKLFGWFANAVLGVNWGGIFQGAVDILKNAGQWIVDLLASGWSAVETWVTGKLDWIKAQFDAIKGVIDDITGIFGGGDGSANSGEADDATYGNNQGGSGTGGVGGGGGGMYGPGGNTRLPQFAGAGSIDTKGMSAMPGIFAAIAAGAAAAAAAIAPVNAGLGAATALTPAVGTFGTTSATSFLGAGQSAQTNLSPIGGIASSMAAALTGAALPAFAGVQAGAVTNFAGMLSAVSMNTSAAATSAGSNTASMASSVVANALSMATGAKSQASAMSSGVSTQMAAMQLGTVTKAAAMAASTGIQFASMTSSSRTSATNIASSMRNGAADAASAVSSGLGRIPGIVSSIGGSAAAAAFSVGANISNSMASGMRSALGSIIAAANAMVAAVDTAVRARARIASPSKMFAALGGYVGEGFEEGIRSMIPDVAKASEALVNTPALPGYNTRTPAYAYGGGGSTTIVHQDNRQFFALKQGEYQQLISNAERGGSHAKAWQHPTEVAQYLRSGRR